jgi:hypothetical protein
VRIGRADGAGERRAVQRGVRLEVHYAAAPVYHETPADTQDGRKKFDFLASHRLANIDLETANIIRFWHDR